jgi:hypothetical protein
MRMRAWLQGGLSFPSCGRPQCRNAVLQLMLGGRLQVIVFPVRCSRTPIGPQLLCTVLGTRSASQSLRCPYGSVRVHIKGAVPSVMPAALPASGMPTSQQGAVDAAKKRR